MKEAFHGSFSEAVQFEQNFRRKNPGLAARLGLSDDIRSIENYVDEYNAARCIAGGWKNFVVMDQSPTFYVPPQKKTLWDGVVGAVKGGRAAIASYASLFGQPGPVPAELAERRAAVCVRCPQNDTQGGLGAHFVQSTAAEIAALLGALRDLELKTSVDDKLGVCTACFCPMAAKVHVSIDVLAKKMPPDVWPRLQAQDPVCWVRQEVLKP